MSTSYFNFLKLSGNKDREENTINILVSMFNPFTLRGAKRGLTILEISYLEKHFPENI